MRILLTGGTGLLGMEICRQLILQGQHDIRCLVRASNTKLPKEVEQVRGNILDIPSISEALKDIDIVIHSAAMVSFNKRDRQNIFENNVQGTANLVNSCNKELIKKFVHISSVAAIGKPNKVLDSKEAVNVDESHKWQESPINSFYAKSKYLAELEVWRAQAEGLKTVILNPSVILGEGELEKSSTQLFNYILKKNRFYSDGYINYVDVQDLADCVIKMAFNETTGERFILNAGRLSFKDFFAKIAVQLKKPSPNIRVSKGMAKILWRIEHLRSILTGSNPLITRETSYSARSNVFFQNSKIKEALNPSFQNVDSTIERVCKFLIDKNSNT